MKALRYPDFGRFAVILAVWPILLLSAVVRAQDDRSSPYMGQIMNDPKTIKASAVATLDLLVMDAISMGPVERLTVTAKLVIPANPKMSVTPPKVSPGRQPGHYDITVLFPQQGKYFLNLNLQPLTGSTSTISISIAVNGGGGEQQMPGMKMPGKQEMPDMPDMSMKGTLGEWPMSREGSGTSWQPESSPMFMKSLSSIGGFDFGMMGTIQGGYVDAGGKRGDEDAFTNSMVMVMGRRTIGNGTLGLHFMTSLDPLLNGRSGVPNLFQNGFEVHGIPVADRKDPHNVFAEIAASYGRRLSRDFAGYIYGGPVGEPALGGVMYFHRPSGLEVPEAPISHDWFDGTHISFGVATIGIVYKDRLKFEGSVFNGHDPIGLYNIGPVTLNSASGRVTYNPSHDWSLSTSYGYLNSDVNEHRFAASASYSHSLSNGDNLSTTAYLGQNIVHGSPTSNGWLVEGTYYHVNDGLFLRFERVDKEELANVPAGSYTVNKLLFGDVHTFQRNNGFDSAIGAYAGIYAFPKALKPLYGSSPMTFGVFLRIRPTKM